MGSKLVELIRKAERRDIPEMVRMAGEFVAASGTGLPFDPDYVADSIRAHMVNSATLSLILDVDGSARGMLCAVAAWSPLAPVMIADEIAWWIDPVHRGRHAAAMLNAYEKWAVRTGCDYLGMVALAGSRTDVIYRRAGYALIETRHVKGL